jgi:hypothetical protein
MNYQEEKMPNENWVAVKAFATLFALIIVSSLIEGW